MTRVAFKQCDVERAIRAAKRAGVGLVLDLKTGKIRFDPQAGGIDVPEAANATDAESYEAEIEAYLNGRRS